MPFPLAGIAQVEGKGPDDLVRDGLDAEPRNEPEGSDAVRRIGRFRGGVGRADAGGHRLSGHETGPRGNVCRAERIRASEPMPFERIGQSVPVSVGRIGPIGRIGVDAVDEAVAVRVPEQRIRSPLELPEIRRTVEVRIVVGENEFATGPIVENHVPFPPIGHSVRIPVVFRIERKDVLEVFQGDGCIRRVGPRSFAGNRRNGMDVAVDIQLRDAVDDGLDGVEEFRGRDDAVVVGAGKGIDLRPNGGSGAAGGGRRGVQLESGAQDRPLELPGNESGVVRGSRVPEKEPVGRMPPRGILREDRRPDAVQPFVRHAGDSGRRRVRVDSAGDVAEGGDARCAGGRRGENAGQEGGEKEDSFHGVRRFRSRRTRQVALSTDRRGMRRHDAE